MFGWLGVDFVGDEKIAFKIESSTWGYSVFPSTVYWWAIIFIAFWEENQEAPQNRGAGLLWAFHSFGCLFSGNVTMLYLPCLCQTFICYTLTIWSNFYLHLNFSVFCLVLEKICLGFWWWLTVCLTLDGIDILTTFIIITQEIVGISNFGVF